ncbi:ABC transporter permease [Aestuariivirga sp. YIM B02566]|uniref:ABC transporter permease n=1 Tax=Taklimakanibacter albus TaxID=2800327 RepID=A0ACC5R3Y9_9HYPH|nr:ABC transporter permease [Aestuariivirga sp. YIM B02566]MBK1867201.1 ABC transporter permease [Aestuariivirga sp. YIM B02566]
MIQRRPDWLAGYGLLSPAIIIMAVMMVTPLLAMVALSFWTQQGFELDRSFTLANYFALVEPSSEPTYWMGIPFPLTYPVPAILLIKSLAMSLAITLAVIALAYPMAYFLAFHVRGQKALWLVLLTIPFWTSYLLRVFAWKIMLGFNGAINSGLKSLGILTEPLSFLLYNPLAVMITLIHAWVAFAVLPIFVSLDKIDRSYLEAATDLGDSRLRRFLQVTLPLSAPGTIGAALLVFIPTVGDYVTPTLVGGPSGTMIGNLIQELFLKQNNAPLGAAVSITMMVTIAAIVTLFLWLIGFRRLRSRAR